MKYYSTKLIDGFSTCFRQWRANHTHCSFLHGYAISFQVTFEAEALDEYNWVTDFGFLRRSKTKINWLEKEYNINEWFKYMFDHTIVIAQDDPQLEYFRKGTELGLLNLRVLPSVGCEKFAEIVYTILNDFIMKESNGRVKVSKVECFENQKNSAIYQN